MKKILFFIFLLFIPVVSAQIENPEIINYLHAVITKSGSVYLEPVGISQPKNLKLTLLIPQNTETQEAYLISVEGPDKYNITHDKFGNQIIILEWKNPKTNTKLKYKLIFDVKNYLKEEKYKEKNFPLTPLIRPSLNITQKAFEVSDNENEIFKIFKLTSWVHEWIKYDKNYMNLTKSAEWVYEKKRGTCDEFSNLLISMLRSLGYNAWYVGGYAYSTSWGPHGWVEVEYNGKIVSLDPTWLESPVDATHIKFITLPDSNQTEAIEVLGNVRIHWDKQEPKIRIIRTSQSPRIRTQTSAIPMKLKSNSYGLIKTRVFSYQDKCILTSLRFQSCKMGKKDFIWSLEKNKIIGFCGDETYYWWVKSPEIKEGKIYTCPVSIYGGGSKEVINLTLTSGRKTTSLYVNTPSVVNTNQNFLITTFLKSSEKEEVYVIFDGIVQSKKVSGETKINWLLNSPDTPGTKTLYVYFSGNLITKNITIVQKKNLIISNISIIKNSKVHVYIHVRNMDNFTKGIAILRINGTEMKQNFSIENNHTKILEFIYTPDSFGIKETSVIILSEKGYQDGWEGSINIPKKKGFLEEIIDRVLDFFEGIFNNILKSIFQ